MSFHFHADDTQLYTTFTYNNELECNNTMARLHDCLADIDTWMTLNSPILYLLYTSPLGDILRRHNMSFHFHADDTQLYTTFTYNNELECNNTMARLHDCLADIDTWMTLNRLKLNKEKTELLVLHSRHRPPPAFASLKIGSEVILPSDSARNVGVIFDNTMTMVPHINPTYKSAFYHLRNIARIMKFSSLKTTLTFSEDY